MVDDPNKNEGGSFIDDEDFLAADAPMAETAAESRNLKEIWDQNPSLKIFAVIAGIAILIIAFMLFSGDDGPTAEEMSNVRPTDNVSQPPGTAELPPAYEEAVRQANQQNYEHAAATGESTIPTPIARPSERIEAPVQAEEVDPLSEWRREAEARRVERQQEEDTTAAGAAAPPPALPIYDSSQSSTITAFNQQAPQAPPPLPTAPTAEQINGISNQLQQFLISNVIEPQTPKESLVISMNIQPPFNSASYFPKNTPADASGTALAGTNGAGASNPAAQLVPPKPLISAGTIAYAQILTEANSDVPGPVLAEIASGPLTGGRAIGQFQVSQKLLVVQFGRIVKDGIEYQTQAYALDPATTLPAIATDVNNHYASRVFLPAAARFIEGFADAAARTDTDVIVTNGTVITNNTNDLDTRQELMQGVNEGAQKMAEIIDNNSDRPITVRIQAGTRIGVLFVQSVIDPNAQPQPQQPGQNNTSPLLGQAYNAYNAANAYSGNNNPYAQQQSAPPGSFAAMQQQQQQAPGSNLYQGRPLGQ